MVTRQRRPFRSTRRGGAPRRRTTWENAVTDNALVAAGGQAVIDLTENFFEEPTMGRVGLSVVRILGTLNIFGSTQDAPGEYAAGIAMIPAEAGVTTLPDPVTDSDFPWLWWTRGATSRSGDPIVARVPVDVKSRRRFREAFSSLVFVIDNDDPAVILEFNIGLRMLFQLP